MSQLLLSFKRAQVSGALGCVAIALLLGTPDASAQDSTSEDSPQRKLYLLHCAGCHGKDGQGDGIAARFVFPKPRDFTTGRMRLVRTVNRVASVEDIRDSISRGFPGTSMQGWEQLGPESLDQLTAEVVRLREQGVRKALVQSLQEDGSTAETEKVDLLVQTLTRAGAVWEGPKFSSPTDASIQRGGEVFQKQSCHSCHGKDGAGSWKMDLVDDKGRPSWATDLRFDTYKGEFDAMSIARRITLGMPGSAMPTSRKLTDQELIDLVHYCQSLARKPKYALTNHQRVQRAIGFRKPPEPTESP